MNKLCIFVGLTIGSYVGWWGGAHWGIMYAFILSSIGSLAGVYLGWRINRQFFS